MVDRGGGVTAGPPGWSAAGPPGTRHVARRHLTGGHLRGPHRVLGLAWGHGVGLQRQPGALAEEGAGSIPGSLRVVCPVSVNPFLSPNETRLALAHPVGMCVSMCVHVRACVRVHVRGGLTQTARFLTDEAEGKVADRTPTCPSSPLPRAQAAVGQ